MFRVLLSSCLILFVSQTISTYIIMPKLKPPVVPAAPIISIPAAPAIHPDAPSSLSPSSQEEVPTWRFSLPSTPVSLSGASISPFSGKPSSWLILTSGLHLSMARPSLPHFF